MGMAARVFTNLLVLGGKFLEKLASVGVDREGKAFGGFLGSATLLEMVGHTIAELGGEMGQLLGETHDLGVTADQVMVDQAQDRLMVGRLGLSVPLLAQGLGVFVAVAFQFALKNILMTLKSYIIRTLLLSGFFFVLIPIAKIMMIKTGFFFWIHQLMDLVRGGREGKENVFTFVPSSSPDTLQGAMEYLVQQIYTDAQSFYEDIDSFIF